MTKTNEEKEDYKERMNLLRIVANKAKETIKKYVDDLEEDIDKSWDEKLFLNLSVDINGIKAEIRTLESADKQSTKIYREYGGLDK